jgi:feruloyl esterase
MWCGVAASPLLAAPALAAGSCEDLSALKAAHVTITVAATVNSAADIAPNLAQSKLPVPFCRVGGFISPTKDSHIGFEVWLPPAASWNHKYEAVGNGGLSGALNYRAMVPGYSRGYATMTTDLGHESPQVEDASWALGHPEKVIDYEYRGEHTSTLAAKQIVDAYYGVAPAHAYYAGCSAGGIQGMTELLRYPKDYDGYIFGDGTPDHLGQEMLAFWNTLVASLADPESALKPAQMLLVHKAVLQQCAGKDGGVASDPFLTDPSACKFEPKTLQCSAGQSTGECLTPKQVAIFEKVYQGPTDPRTHAVLFPGVTPGTELGWDRYFTGKTNPAGVERPWAGFLADMVYNDPTFLTQQKYLKFSFDKDYKLLRQTRVAGETLDASWNTRNRDVDAFAQAGGKVIHYHGWDDPNIPSMEAVKLFMSVVADQAKRHHMTSEQALAETQKFYRLFMVPGMGHCSGGEGPSDFGQNASANASADPESDTLSALERWVEQGKAPEHFVASRVDAKTRVVSMTRPVCAYPKKPIWNGVGDTNDARSFYCAVKPPSPKS